MERTLVQRLLVVVPLLFAACATTGFEGARARVTDLTASVEQVSAAAEAMRMRTAEALTQLRSLTESGQDAAAACSRVLQAIDAAEQQARNLHEAVGPMKTAAAQVFEQWDRDVAAITNEDLQQRGKARLQRSKDRFAAIVAASDAAEIAVTTFNRTLRDQMLFLGHDLNRESLREVRAELLNVAASEKEASSQLESCRKAAHTYVNGASLPADSPAAGPAR